MRQLWWHPGPGQKSARAYLLLDHRFMRLGRGHRVRVPVHDLPRNMLVRPNASASPGRSLDLKVPSVTVRGQHNYLIDPAHPDFAGIEVYDSEPPDLDPRITGV